MTGITPFYLTKRLANLLHYVPGLVIAWKATMTVEEAGLKGNPVCLGLSHISYRTVLLLCTCGDISYRMVVTHVTHALCQHHSIRIVKLCIFIELP